MLYFSNILMKKVIPDELLHTFQESLEYLSTLWSHGSSLKVKRIPRVTRH